MRVQKPTSQAERYLSYLLRMWQTSNGEDQTWQASLESPGTGERRGFGDLEELYEFLNAQTDESSPDSARDDESWRE